MAKALARFLEEYRWIVILLAGAAIVRFAYLLYYSGLPEWNQLTVDNFYHLHWAQRIADGDLTGGTTYFRAPLYVYLLAAVISIFGDSLWTLRVLGLLIGCSSVFLTFLLGRSLFGTRIGLLAALIHAVYPTAIYFDGELLLDPLFTLLTQIALWQTIRWWSLRAASGAFWSGLLWGLAAITRPTALLLVAALVAAMLVWRPSGSGWLRPVLAMLAGLALCIVPIAVRNLAVAGDPVLIASQGGVNLFIGNNPHADGISAVLPQPFGHNWQIADMSAVAEAKEGHPLTPGEVSDYWAAQAYRWMLHHPLDWLKLMLQKLSYSVADREISNNRDLAQFFVRVPFLHWNPLSFAWIIALGVIGAIVSWVSSPRSRFLTVAVFLFIAANSLFFVNSRFRLPEIPLLVILAVVGFTWLVNVGNIRSKRGMMLTGAALAVFLFSRIPAVSFPAGQDATGLASQAIYQYRTGDFRQSIITGHAILQRVSDFPETNLNIGAAWFRLGNGDSAKTYFERERFLYPGRAKAYTNLASYYLVNRQFDSVYFKLNRALLLRPYDLAANTLLLRLATADSSVGEEEFAGYLRSAVMSTDSNLTLLVEAATAASQRRSFALAEQLFRAALVTSPPAVETDDLAFDEAYPYTPKRLSRLRARTHYELGFVLGQTGRFDESVKESRAAIQLDSTLSEAWVNLFSGFLSLGMTQAADSLLTDAAARFPSDPNIRQLLTRFRR